jgi:O-antigen/teichoic acid export membrane protein
MKIPHDSPREGLPQVQSTWLLTACVPRSVCSGFRQACGWLGGNQHAAPRLHLDFLSLGLTQALAALGQIIGVRLLTEALSPAVFGEVILVVGMSMLATSVLVNPTMQALLRYYPEYAQTGDASPVVRTALRRIIRTSAYALPLSVPLAIVGVVAGWISVGVLVLLLILTAVDGMRLLRATVMNASSQHHRYGIWQVGEAWGRPLLAYGATIWWGGRAEVVLAVFIVTSLALYGVMGHSPASRSTAIHSRDLNEDDLLRKFQTYGWPLIPLGLVGWISGMADRYMIGGMLSAENVGMYAAAYGLASRPLLMLSSMAETAVRPLYYSAVARRDISAERKYLMTWFAVVSTAGIAVCLLFALFHEEVAALLLGPRFREGSYLMPWIAGGYGLLALYHISARVCLGNDAPQAVTVTETAGAILAVVIGFVFIQAYGLWGAAVAVPIYYGVQLLGSVCLAVRSVRAKRAHPAAPVASTLMMSS